MQTCRTAGLCVGGVCSAGRPHGNYFYGMNATYLLLILVATVAAVIAETVTLLFPDSLLQLIEKDPGEQFELTLFQKVSGILSVAYMADIALLLFSGDSQFRLYAMVLVGLSLVIWIVRKRVPYFRYVLIAESTVCLVLLLDTARTAVRLLGWFPV